MSVTAPPPTSAPPRPDLPGWSGAASAVHATGRIQTPILLVLEPAGFGQIVVDFRHRAYSWDVPLEAFPVDPQTVRVQTQALSPTDPPLFELPGRNLDALLWMIGLNSYDTEPAPWLREGHRYRLARWPNLTELVHTPDQLRMIAILGNAYLTPEQLAESAGVELAEAQRLINALSLAGVLRRAAAVADVPVISPTPEPEPSRSPGLLRRLLEKLGR